MKFFFDQIKKIEVNSSTIGRNTVLVFFGLIGVYCIYRSILPLQRNIDKTSTDSSEEEVDILQKIRENKIIRKSISTNFEKLSNFENSSPEDSLYQKTSILFSIMAKFVNSFEINSEGAIVNSATTSLRADLRVLILNDSVYFRKLVKFRKECSKHCDLSTKEGKIFLEMKNRIDQVLRKCIIIYSFFNLYEKEINDALTEFAALKVPKKLIIK